VKNFENREARKVIGTVSWHLSWLTVAINKFHWTPCMKRTLVTTV